MSLPTFTFEKLAITLMFVILVIDSTILIFIVFTGQAIINSVENKLDAIHTQEQIQVNQQGNLSQHSRDILIKQFGDVANQGGFATHQDIVDLQHALQNKTH